MSAQLLGLRLKNNVVLVSKQDKPLVYCYNIAGLTKSMDSEYDATVWRFFIASSSRRLKEVLHNENSFASIPIGHSVQMKETYNSMYHLLSAFNSQIHKWLVCGDL